MVRCCGAATRRKYRVGIIALIASLVMAGCKASVPEQAPSRLQGSGAPASFQYLLPEGGAFGTGDLFGRDTVLLFVTTYDNLSLAVARKLLELSRTRKPRINVVVVVLEPPQNAPLVTVYRDALSSELSAVLADQETLEGRGAFGDMRQVPGVILLDRDGRVVLRGFGAEAYQATEQHLRATAAP